ncbi:MAG: MOSC domain-containing protein [Clostridium argentinense]|uniref:MOSC domain-containing protein n=1 Tax=Clostridium faecium TaxID=2762223 RepID=A0ABR8YPX1_9CLOT|nr:MOSC domain-containing protein [Clostridium faecium]MBD8046280.1 MOSC domain-containing protein [Clostridium faecium]MBS5824233.1 MOSC domain-containing protein [Clostridium argentinense]MDU1349492.1 molybdopterin-binding protein [Clostridium argentinense]
MGIIKGICISEKRGTKKHIIKEANFIENWGIENDAHAGNWHRQVSLLSFDKIEVFREKGADVSLGDFGENLIVEGFDFKKLPVGTRFYCGEVILEMTQVGKECHSHCEIYKTMGDCIMPREGVFAKVVQGGKIKAGDEMTMELPPIDSKLTAAVITLSDKGFKGERIDESGPAIVAMLKEAGYEIVETIILPDEQKQIERNLIRLSDQRQVNLILTTGGTGFSKRDCTPEATMAVATRNAPGIAEAIRYGSMNITKRAMLGRGASVIRNETIIVNLPGSKKAVVESLRFIIDELEHGIKILKGSSLECGRK